MPSACCLGASLPGPWSSVSSGLSSCNLRTVLPLLTNPFSQSADSTLVTGRTLFSDPTLSFRRRAERGAATLASPTASLRVPFSQSADSTLVTSPTVFKDATLSLRVRAGRGAATLGSPTASLRVACISMSREPSARSAIGCVCARVFKEGCRCAIHPALLACFSRDCGRPALSETAAAPGSTCTREALRPRRGPLGMPATSSAASPDALADSSSSEPSSVSSVSAMRF